MKRSLIAIAALLAGAAFAAPPAGTKLADEANATSTQFKLTSRASVSSGAGANWTEKTFDAGGPYVCHWSTFGLKANPSTARQQCKYTIKGGGVAPVAPPVVTPPASAPLVHLTGQSGTFKLTTTTTVSYGVDGRFNQKTLPAGTHECTDQVFGDPAPGLNKGCYAAAGTTLEAPSTSTPAAEPAAPSVPPTSAAPDLAAYRAIAATFGTDAGIRYRYGDPSSIEVKTTLYGPRKSYDYKTISVQRFEKQSDGNVGDRSCGRDGWCGEYQFGSPDKLTGGSGDYSSNIANVGYLPDVTTICGQKPYGMASLQQLSVAHNAVAWSPEPSWTTYTGCTSGWNDESVMRMSGDQANSPIGIVPMASPVATVRGYGRNGWVNNALNVMSNGWIVATGSNTSRNFMKVKLPDNKKPTGAAITNSGEFLLVTVWDVDAFKGQVAVIALADGCAYCEDKPESEWERNWGSARGAYPGMPGLGNYLGAKVVGYVDLPDTMRHPTEISATTGRPGDDYEIVRDFWNEDMRTAAMRSKLYDGETKSAVARSGMAVVISKADKRAAFIDLRPLFMYYREQYLNKTDAAWNAMIASRGPDAKQWPYTFDVAPAQSPVVVKVVDLPAAPTAVKVSLEAPHRAFIATQEGKLRMFDLGTAYLDQAGAAAGKPDQIAERFTIDVGANPTSLGYMKQHMAKDDNSALFGKARPRQFLWALSRGEKKASLLQFDPGFNSANVFRTLQDSRIVDPIALEDGDNHGTESYTVSIADYSGKKLHTIGYGPVIMWTYDRSKAPCPYSTGCAMNGGAEYAGSYTLPGRPFHVVSSNIN